MPAGTSPYHRRSSAHRLSRIGLAGLTGALLVSPLAYAETPEPTTPGSTVVATPVAPAASPSSTAPVTPSSTPSPGTGSTGPTSVPTLVGPTPADPTASDAGRPAGSAAPTRPSALSTPSTPATRQPRLRADFGITKVRVGARVAPGSTPPDGVTTAGSVIRVEHVGEGSAGQGDLECTTAGPPDADGVTFCPEQITIDPADSLVVTQLSAPDGLRVPAPAARSVDPVDCGGTFCSGPDVVFDDPAEDAPTAVDDAFEAVEEVPVDLGVVANDDLRDQDVTGLTTTQPSHGTVTVDDARSGSVTYTADADFIGEDTFTYTVTTSAGSATATVTVAVEAGPSPSSSGATTSAGGGPGSDHSGGATTLAATGAPAASGALAVLGAALSSLGAVLLLRRRRGSRGKERHG